METGERQSDLPGRAGSRRPRYPMPDTIRLALEARGLMEAYHDQPDYQQNDYIGWITRAKRQETFEKRLKQMLDELEGGDRYMAMSYRPGRVPTGEPVRD